MASPRALASAGFALDVLLRLAIFAFEKSVVDSSAIREAWLEAWKRRDARFGLGLSGFGLLRPEERLSEARLFRN